MTAMVRACDEEPLRDDEELVANLASLLLAGFETTTRRCRRATGPC
ncbi:hypothetical protein [Streptomyces griseoruber]